jgi:hypothetical protein
MNSKRYKLIFSKRLNALVVVGENCVSTGKSISETRGSESSSAVSLIFTRFIGALCLGFVLVSTAFADPAANVLPVGGVVVQGEAVISQTANTMSINQATSKAIVNWQGFDIGAAATVNVIQPNNSSVLLSRVVGNNPSQIFGLLNANGQVVLINPNGITFGADGSINASAFTASTLDMHDADFMSGNYRFFSTGVNGEIVNQGGINTTGYVALLGANVTNDGFINTNGGNVYLGSGQSVIVPISNSGRIKMELSPASINAAVENTKNGIIVSAGGQVYMQASALNDLVASLANSGQIDTSATQAGNVSLLADGGQIKVDGSIKANSALEANNGGDIIIGRDVDTGLLSRSTDVSGALLESRKGFVETSGAFLKVDNIKVKAGEWLLDPTNIIIAADGTSVSGTAYVANYTAGADSVILASSINSSLNLGTSVTIATSATGASEGNITVNESIAKTAGVDATLTLKAHGNIVVATSKTITSTTGMLNVVFNSDFDGNASGAILFNNGSGITSNGGNITLGGGSGGAGAGSARGNATNPNAITLTGANINAAGGSIVMTGTTNQFGAGPTHGISLTNSTVSTTGVGTSRLDGWTYGTAAYSSGVAMFGSTVTGGSGDLLINGSNLSAASANTSLQGVWLDAAGGVSSTVTSNGGRVFVTGIGGAGAGSNYGVVINGGLVTSGVTGSVNVIGTGGAGTGSNNAGVILNGSSSSTGISSSGGQINVTGTAGAGASQGVWFLSGASSSIVSGNNAGINLTTDSFVMDSGAINAGAGIVTIRNRTSATKVNVGGTGTDTLTGAFGLDVSSAELGKISASKIVVGRNDATGSGAVTVNALNMGALGNTGGDLTVLSSTNIAVNDSVTKTAGADSTLSLLANNNITVATNKTITASLGKLNVLLNSDSDASGSGSIVFNSGSGVTSNGGNITLGGGSVLNGSGTAVGDGVSSFTGISLVTAAFDAGGGNIAMTGTTFKNAAANTSNVHGILVTNGSIKTAGAGKISLNGFSNTITDTLSKAIQTSGVTITGGSTGTVSLLGDSRSATAVGNYLYGVSLGTNTVVTSLGGNIEITGYGGNGSGGLASNIGVALSSAKVTGVGAGKVNITGTGGQGSAGTNFGVYTNGASAAVSSQGADINIIGQGGNGSNSEGILIGGGTVGVATGTTSANVILTSDSTKIQTAAINSGTGTTTIQNRTVGTLINVGGADVLNTSPLTLGVTNAEMNLITAGTLKIGSTTSGAMTTSAAVTTAAARGNIHLQSGSTLTASTALTSAAGLLLQTTGGAISTTAALSGTNVSLDNTGGSVNWSSGALTAGVSSGSATNAINIASSITATGNVNIMGNVATTTNTGVNLTSAGSITSSGTAATISITSNGNLVNAAAIKNTASTGTGSTITLTSASGNISGAGAIGDTTNKGADVIFNQAGTSSYSGAINAKNFTKSGAGSLTLTSWRSLNLTNVSNAYTVNGGGLTLDSDSATLTYPTFAPAAVNVVNASSFSLSSSSNGRWNNTAFNFTGGLGGGTMNLGGNPIGALGTINTFSTSGGATNTINGGLNANSANVNLNLTPASSGTALLDNSFAAINFANGYSQTSNRGIGGATTITVSGGGNLLAMNMLAATNLNINAGYVQFGTNAAETIATSPLLSATNVNIAAGTTLAFNKSVASANSSIYTGTGNLIQSGTGVVTLTGSSSAFAGATTIDTGKRLAIGTGGNLGAAGSTVTLASNTSNLSFTNTSGTSTVGSTISGAGTVTANGAGGTGVLLANNNYTGVTTTTAGTLQVGNGGAVGSLGTGSVTNNSALVFNRSDNITVTNAISGTGTVTQAGSGVLTFPQVGTGTVNNTYTGQTFVNAGTLSLKATTNTAQYGTGQFNIATGATLNFDVASGISTTAFTNTTFAGNGTMTKTGLGSLNWNTTAATFNLGAGSLIDVQAGNFVGGSNSNEVWTNNLSSLNVAAGAQFVGSEANVRVDALTGAGNVTTGWSTSGSIAVGVNNTAAGTYNPTAGTATFSGVIDSTTANTTVNSLSKLGTGTQILTGANIYKGVTLIEAGTLQVGDGGTTGSLGTGAVTDNGNLTINRSNAYTLANAISGTGKLNQIGSGTTTLTATNTYSGGTTISAGVLQVGNGTTVGSLGSGPVVDNALLIINRSDAVTLTQAISGTGSVLQQGTGTTKLASNANTFSGGITISKGAVMIGNGGGINGNYNLNSGSGVITLGDANTGTSNVALQIESGIGGGQVALNNSMVVSSQGTGTATIGAVVGSGNSLFTQSQGALTLNRDVILNDGTADRFGFNGKISGTGNISITGNRVSLGSLNANGISSNDFVGNVTIASGSILQANAKNLLPTTTNLISNGTLRLLDGSDQAINALSGSGTVTTMNASGNNITTNLSIGNNNGSATFTGTITGSAPVLNLIKNGSGTEILTGANTYTGTTTINGGTLQIGNGSNTGTLGTGAVSVAANSNLDFFRSDAAVTIANSISGAGVVNFKGTGVQGQSGYNPTGNNSSLSGSINVLPSARLSINAANQVGTAGITINSGGGLYANGAFTVNNALSLAGNGWNESTGYLGAMRLQNGTNYAGAITLAADARITAYGSTGIVSGVMSGAKNLDFNSGTVTLTGNNVYTGMTTISGGTLQIGNAGTTGTLGEGDVTLSNNANLRYVRSAATTIANNISGAGNVSATITGAASDLTVDHTIALTSGTVNLVTDANLLLSQAISTSNATSSAILLNAGKPSAAGTSTGGDVKVSGSGALTVAAGGRATVMTGSISGSTGVTGLVGSGSGNFRYNSDEVATNYSTALGAGTYAIYREAPTASLTINNDTKTYNGLAYTGGNGYTLNSGGANGDTAAQIGAGISYGGTSQNTKNVGTYTITGSANPLGYSLSYVAGTLTVNKADLSVTANAVTKTYDGTTTATGHGTVGTLAGQGAGESVNSVGSQAFTDKNVGTANKTVKASGVTVKDNVNVDVTSNYNIIYTDNTASTINKADLTVTATEVTKTYDGTTTATGTGTVGTLAGTGDSVNTIGLQAFTDKNVGAANKTVKASGVTIKDSSSADMTGNYNISYIDNNSSTINRAAIELTTSNVTKTYDGTLSANGSATVKTGTVFSGDSLSGGSFAFTDKNFGAGNKIVTTSGVTVGDGTNNSNYEVSYANNTTSTINKATLSAALTGTVEKVYDGTTTVSNLTNSNFAVTGWVSVEGVSEGASVTQTNATYDSKNVSENGGTGGVSATLAANQFTENAGTSLGNYTLPTTVTGAVGKITPASLNIKVNNSSTFVTLDPNAAKDNGFSYTGFKNGETAATALTGMGTRTYTGTDNPIAGDYADVYGLSATPTANNGNYTINVSNGKLTVIPADKLLITIGEKTETYGVLDASNAGDSASSVLAQYCLGSCVTGLVNLTVEQLNDGSWRATDSTNTSVTFNTLIDSAGHLSTGGYLNVGSYIYDASATSPSSTGNFTGSSVSGGVLTIQAKTLVLNDNGVSKVYDGNQNIGLTTLSNNAMSGDDVSASATSGLFVSKNAGNRAFTLNGVGLSGNDASNYAVDSDTFHGSGTITAKQVALTATNVTKVYDGLLAYTTTSTELDALSAQLGVVGDIVTAATIDYLDKNAGVGDKTVSLSNVTVSDGNSGNNYTVTLAGNKTSTITKKDASITGTATNVTYNATTQIQDAAVLDGFIAADVSSGSVGATGVATGRNAGTYNSNLVATGTDKDNYNITVTNKDLVIAKKDASITGTTTNVTYNATTQIQDAAVLDGFIAADVSSGSVGATGVATGRNAGTYTSDLVATGTDKDNYNITVTNKDLVIAKKDASITGTVTNVTYNSETQNQDAAVLDGFIAADVTNNTVGATGVATGRNAGTYTSDLVATGTDKDNYNITVTNKDLVIAKKDASITGTVTNVTYNSETQNQDAAVLDGFIAADVTNNTVGATGVATGRNAGTYTSSLVATGTDKDNYNITVTNKDLVIAKKDASITGTLTNVTYNSETQNQGAAVLDGFIASDVTNNTIGATGEATGRNAGTYSSNLSATGDDKDNYNITVTNKDLVIAKKNASITGATTNVTYNATTQIQGAAVLDGFIAADVTNNTIGATGEATGRNAGTYSSNLSATGDDKDNYNITVTNKDLVIAKKDASITGTLTNVTYNSQTQNQDAAVLDGFIADDVTSGSVSVNGLATGRNAGTYTSNLSATGLDKDNYNITVTNRNLVIAKKNASITGSTTNVTYNATTQIQGAAVLDGFIADDVTSGSVSITGLATGRNAGTYTSNLSATGLDKDNYNITVTNRNLVIAKKNASITGTVTNVTYNSQTQNQRTALLSGFIAADLINNTVGATGEATGRNAGTYTSNLSATGADKDNYNITVTNRNLMIAKKDLAISATATDKVYDTTTDATAALTSDMLSGDSLTLAKTSANFDTKNVGTDKTVTVAGLSISGTDAGNYNLTNTSTTTTADITKKDLAISATATDKVYDTTTDATAALTSDMLSGDSLTLAKTSANFDTKNVGTDKTVTVAGLSISGTDAGNYNLTNTSTTTTADITKKDLAISATATDKVYDTTTDATAALTSDMLSGDSLTLAKTSANFDTKNVGTDKTVTVAGLSISGTDAGNYNLTNTSTTTTADITKKDLAISATATDKVYDTTTDATAALTSDMLSGDSLTLAKTSANFDTKNVGTDKTVTVAGLSISGTDAGNYNLTNTSTTTTADITKKDLAISATATDKVYDTTTDATAALTSDMLSGDSLTLAKTSANFDTKNVGTDKTVTVAGLSISGTDAGNYNLTNTSTTTTADITKKDLAISATATDKVYDTTTDATAALTSDMLSGDSLTLAKTSANFDTKNVGTDKTVTVAGLSISGTDAGNYNLTNTSTTTTADITKKDLAISATATDKVYDTTTDATAALTSDMLSGDSLTLAKTSANFDTKNVGTDKTVTVAGLSISGTDAGNYNLTNTSTTTTADITKKDLAISATATDKVYDTTTDATAALTSDMLSGDSLTLAKTSANFDTKNVGTDKTVTVAGLSISGTDAGNYNLTNTSTTTTADITKKDLAISATATDKVYDTTTDATAALTSDMLSGDSLTLAKTSANFDTKNVGTDKTVTVAGLSISGTDAGNYNLTNTSTTTTADITKKDLAISATATDKVYDTTTDATAALTSDMLSGDSLTLAKTSANFDTKNVGTDKTVTVAGLSISGTDAGNYNLTNTSTTTTADITKKDLAISATATDKVYDTTTDATAALTSDMLSGDSLTLAKTSANFDTKNVGTDKTVTVAGLSISGTDAGNYNLTNTSTTTTADITKKDLAISATATDKVYDTTTDATAALTSDMLSGDSLTLAKTSANFDTKNVGTDKTVTVAGLSISGTDAGNYNLTNTSTTTTADITKKDLAISATATDKVYDTTTDATAALTSDMLSGDSLTLAKTSANFDTKNVGTDKTVTVAGLSISGTDAGNYNLTNTSTTTTADITKKDLAISATATDKVYDTTTDATAALTSDMLSGDSLTLAKTSANFDTKNVGTDKTVTVAGLSISGTDAGNYNLTNTSTTTTASIEKATLQLQVGDVTKVYDGTTTLEGAALTPSGVLANDVVSVVANAGDFDTKDAGSQIGFTLSGLTLTGSDSGNYTLGSAKLSGVGSITPKQLTMLGSIAKDKVFDGNTKAVVVSGTLNGLVGNETLVITTNANFADPAIGSNKLVLSSYALANGLNGGVASNYILADENLTASITSNRPIVNPVAPVIPVSPSGSGGASSRVSVTVGQVQAKIEPPKQCSIENPEQCECKETLIPEISLCVLPFVVSVVE